MATAFTPTHTHSAIGNVQSAIITERKVVRRGKVATFFSDLIEDVFQKPLQPAALAKHDMFREHILAMSIAYFALILILIGASLPILASLKY